MNYWEQYYQKTNARQIPWEGTEAKFFEYIWNKFGLPKKGSILDIGCGRGKKSIYLAQKGFDVWAFDISKTATRHAKRNSVSLKNKPTFFVGDAAKLNKIKELENLKFDIVIDLVTSQFLNKKEKEDYLSSLKDHTKPNKTFYVFVTFAKDSQKDQLDGSPDWVKQIALSPKDVKTIYGKWFRVLDRMRKFDPKGKVDSYIMLSKGKSTSEN